MLMLTTEETGRVVAAQRVRLRDRLVARLAAGTLDRRLAAGVAPDRSPALALRAQWLIGASARRKLAAHIRTIVADARNYDNWRRPCIVASRHAVRTAADDLDALADRLAGGLPVSARGMAQAQLLLSDPTSPLYEHGTGAAVRAAASATIVALQPLTA